MNKTHRDMHPRISFSPICSTTTHRFPSIFHTSSSTFLSSTSKNCRRFFARSSVSMEKTTTTPNRDDVAHDFSPFLRVYKDGRVERLKGIDIVPPSLDPENKVLSKDVVYFPEADLSSRLFLPQNTSPDQKRPLLIYYHGGGFCVNTPFNHQYSNYVHTLVAEAKVIAVSVDYRKSPEQPLPIGYEDSWTALKWVASHVNGNGPEEWLNCHADFGKVFLAGDSAGGNIAHQMATRHGEVKVPGINLVGIVLIHPFFWGKEPVRNESTDPEKRRLAEAIWRFACPTTGGCDDPLINPFVDPRFSRLGCSKVLVLVAEKDGLRGRGWYYYEKLKESGWGGEVDIMECEGEDHVFHLEDCTCDNAVAMLKRTAAFINEARAKA